MLDRILAVTTVLALLAPSVAVADDSHPEREVDDYLALPGRLPASAKRAQPRTDAEVDALVASITKQPLASGPLDVADVVSALGPGFAFMRSALAKSPPRFEVVSST